ncbi:MAG: lytic transglycosylase domain-containing protein [Alphaproteobacteria bacterium]
MLKDFFVRSLFMGVSLLAASAYLPASSMAASSPNVTLSSSNSNIYREALKQAEAGRINNARQMIGATNPVFTSLLDWVWLRPPTKSAEREKWENGAVFRDYAAFLAQNPTFPDNKKLAYQAERHLTGNESDSDILAFFEKRSPATYPALLRLASAMQANGLSFKLADLLRDFVINGEASADDIADMAKTWPNIVNKHIIAARVDRLLWADAAANAQKLLPLLTPEAMAAATARIKLANNTKDAEEALAKVPPSLRKQEGLLYERFAWRLRNDNEEAAMQLLAELPKKLAYPDKWWLEQNRLIRQLVEDRQFSKAYQLSAHHGQVSGQGLATAEFMAGWLALRRLHQPAIALKHFTNLYEQSTTPISKARGGYWAARAATEIGNQAVADAWLKKAAAFPSAFYGQIAIDQLSAGEGDFSFPPINMPPKQAVPAVYEGMRQLVLTLQQIGRKDLADVFLRHFGENAETVGEAIYWANLAAKNQQLETAVRIAKKTDQKFLTPLKLGYPLLPMNIRPQGVDLALVHALTRQESMFNPAAISPSDARGLMQLLPSTAKDTARKNDIDYDESRLTSDISMNVRLGSAYIGEMLQNFGNRQPLAIAAYNAGPGRVRQWLDKLGPFPNNLEAALDWLEMIPVYETRNYVQRVMENEQIYRYLLSGKPCKANMVKNIIKANIETNSYPQTAEASSDLLE